MSWYTKCKNLSLAFTAPHSMDLSPYTVWLLGLFMHSWRYLSLHLCTTHVSNAIYAPVVLGIRDLWINKTCLWWTSRQVQESGKNIIYSMINVLVQLKIKDSSKELSCTGHCSCVNKTILLRAFMVFYYLSVFLILKNVASGRVLFQKWIFSDSLFTGKMWQTMWCRATSFKELNFKMWLT